MRKWTRRAFVGAGVGAAAAASVPFVLRGRPVTGSIVGASLETAHRLRARDFPSPSRRIEVPVAILGGGIAGLGAAWRLDRSGAGDFLLFELEASAGGNARSGRNGVSAYPWGAHYVPVPNAESRAVRDLFRDLGVITGTDGAGRPVYDERFLCFAPQERLFVEGEWEEGIFPRRGASPEDLDQLRDFSAAMEVWRRKEVFRIPLDLSERDPELLALDRVTMDEFLRRNGWTSPRLRWHVEYGCRDDYGCTLSTTSAWAGLHYFASRHASSPEGGGTPVLTWPEGNGWIVDRIAERLGSRLRCGALVTGVAPEDGRVRVRLFEPARDESIEVVCRHAILALPRFVAGHVVEPWRASPPEWMPAFTYAPWMVANLAVDRVPAGRGFEPAWDNVIHGSESLGYVVATHQSLATGPGPSVLTYYRPFTGPDPAGERRSMASRAWADWRDEILADLSKAHPDIASLVRSIDVMRWGHAMIRPVPGFLWGDARRRAAEPLGNLHFAHSDLSGLSLFEEALDRGVSAADAVLARLR